MAELLVKAVGTSHPDPEQDRGGSYKRGMPVLVKPDGHEWGAMEQLPHFVVIKVPGISVSRLEKYVAPQYDTIMPDVTYRRRRWIIRWADLPLAARNKLQTQGFLVVQAGSYTGPSDYNWTQIRDYFRDQLTGQNESGEI